VAAQAEATEDGEEQCAGGQPSHLTLGKFGRM
jgi:hypothetical protein